MSYKVTVIKEGYSHMASDTTMVANSTCTVVTGPKNILVDTLSPWDKDALLQGLKKQGLKCSDINYVVCTHGHIDHIGNLNLFPNAMHIVGYSVSHRDHYYIHPFEMNMPYVIDDKVEVIPTPGHTATDVSVLVHTDNYGIVAIVGDLFEREEDIIDSPLWRDMAASENPQLQEHNRNKILRKANYIIPGHGPMFVVTDHMRPRSPEEVDSEIPETVI